MRRHALRNLNFVGNLSLSFLLLLAFAVCFVSIRARAQNGIWQVDAGHSIARLSLGAGSQSVDVGVAPVSGTVVFDSSDPAERRFTSISSRSPRRSALSPSAPRSPATGSWQWSANSPLLE
jgi:hypothetical protein